MTKLRISVVQYSPKWLDPIANMTSLERLIAPLVGQTDLIVFPEMFVSGFVTDTGAAELSVLESLQTVPQWLLSQAHNTGAALAGSSVLSETGGQFNRFLFAKPDDQLEIYDKVHLFKMGGEHERYQKGRRRVIVKYRHWRIFLNVCYDLRFPVFCRNCDDYDLMLCVANWPDSRADAWKSLLVARAIENQSYVVGVNRIGTDGKGLHYSGDSTIIDYSGKNLIAWQSGAYVKTLVIDLDGLRLFREKYQFLPDRDNFTLHLEGS